MKVGPNCSNSELAQRKMETCILPAILASTLSLERDLLLLNERSSPPQALSSAGASSSSSSSSSLLAAASSSSSSSSSLQTVVATRTFERDDDDDDDDDDEVSSENQAPLPPLPPLHLPGSAAAAAATADKNFSRFSDVPFEFILLSPYTQSSDAKHDGYEFNITKPQQKRLMKALQYGDQTGSKSIDDVYRRYCDFVSAHKDVTSKSQERPPSSMSFVNPSLPEIDEGTGIRKQRPLLFIDGEKGVLDSINEYAAEYTKKIGLELAKTPAAASGATQPNDLQSGYRTGKRFFGSSDFIQFVLPTDQTLWPMIARKVYAELGSMKGGHRDVFSKFFYNVTNMLSTGFTETNILSGWRYMNSLDGVLEKWPTWGTLSAGHQKEIKDAIPKLARNVIGNTGTLDDDFAYEHLGHILGEPNAENEDDESDGATDDDASDDEEEASTKLTSGKKNVKKTKIRDLVLNRHRAAWCSSAAGRFHTAHRLRVMATKNIMEDLKRALKGMLKEEKTSPAKNILRLVAAPEVGDKTNFMNKRPWGVNVVLNDERITSKDTKSVAADKAAEQPARRRQLAPKCANTAFCDVTTNTVGRTKCDKCGLTFCAACVAAGYVATHQKSPGCRVPMDVDEEEGGEKASAQPKTAAPPQKKRAKKAEAVVGGKDGGGGSTDTIV